MLKDDFEKLYDMLSRSADDKSLNLSDVLKESVHFFNALKEGLILAPLEERKEMLGMMQQLYSKLQEVYKLIAQRSGMSEEDLYAYSENPSNFSADQWRLMQDTKQELFDVTRQLYSQAGKKEEAPKLPEKPKKKVIKTKRSHWTKS